MTDLVLESTSAGETEGYKPLQVASESQGDEDEPDEADGDIDLDEDVYGAAIFSFIFDSFEIIHATDSNHSEGEDHDGLSLKMNIARISFVSLILVCNYLLQGSMLFFIVKFVVLTTLHETQRVYQRYHSEVFTDGAYDAAKWETFDAKDSLCGIAFSNFFFMYAILCLWWCTMLKDVRLIDKMRRNMSSVAHAATINDMIQFPEEGSDEPVRVKAFVTPIRMLLYFGILLPKLLISSGLLLIGTVWLSATDNFGDLILNAVALEFVIGIDELLFEAMLPGTIRERICETKLWVKPKKSTPESNAKNVKAQYIRSLTYFLTVTVGVYIFMSIGQYIPRLGVLPNYANDAMCPVYLKDTTSWVCAFNSYAEDCFPFS